MSRRLLARLRSFLNPDSLRIQLLSRSLLVLAVLLVLVGLLQYVFMKDLIYRNKAASMRSQVMSIPPDAWLYFSTSPEYSHIRPPRFFIPGANLAFIDMHGNYSVLFDRTGGTNPPRLAAQEYFDALEGRRRQRYKVVGAGREEQLVVLQPVLDHGQVLGIIQASTLTSPLKELLVRQLLIFLALSAAAMLVGLLGFLPVLKRTLVPLANMVDTAEQIDAGNLAKRFPTRQGQVEIDRLAESFNRMLERLEASFAAERETKEQMRRFIADASHELRTPLTAIHGFLEVLLRGAANQPEQLHKALKNMYGESVRLNKLVHDLLELAKLDRMPNIEIEEGSLDAVVRDMEPQLRVMAGGRRLSLQVEPDVRCRFNADKMKQVILNLFHNAVQHTDPDKGHIQISLFKYNGGVRLSVRDNGPGISAHHLPRIFERFYRVDASRARKHGGSGLGLSIAKSIIDAHGGTISVESKEGEGSAFHVWLPV